MKKLILGLTILLASCGGGSDPAPDFTRNSDGYPTIAGNYAFRTEKIAYQCSDNSVGSSTGVTFNVQVSQTGNVIDIISTATGNPSPGITILESSGLNGNVQKNGQFKAVENATATFDAFPNELFYITWSLDGSFNTAGWNGLYNYVVSSTTIVCTYSTTFTGEKL